MTLCFSHEVRTSRRYVFENIMDLEHVCSLHKKWFRNLRIIVQTPDYFEYRLTSLFYGLKQEIRVRGGIAPSWCNQPRAGHSGGLPGAVWER